MRLPAQTQPAQIVYSEMSFSHFQARQSAEKPLKVVDAVKGMWREQPHGRAFTRGLGVCLVRAIPVNMVTFMTYEVSGSHVLSSYVSPSATYAIKTHGERDQWQPCPLFVRISLCHISLSATYASNTHGERGQWQPYPL